MHFLYDKKWGKDAPALPAASLQSNDETTGRSLSVYHVSAEHRCASFTLRNRLREGAAWHTQCSLLGPGVTHR